MEARPSPPRSHAPDATATAGARSSLGCFSIWICIPSLGRESSGPLVMSQEEWGLGALLSVSVRPQTLHLALKSTLTSVPSQWSHLLHPALPSPLHAHRSPSSLLSLFLPWRQYFFLSVPLAQTQPDQR
uniref:Uncharacterized bone marrow protein BM045 n=1 Tax=Homo sapiens TaxID=9606 RepID=Q9NZ78_HUMAN|nr:uncharacterized bone marrow protein BM045 [Homo sapiens]